MQKDFSLQSTRVLIHLPGLVYLRDKVSVHIRVCLICSAFISLRSSCEVPVELGISI